MDIAFSNLLSFLTQEMDGVWYSKHKALSLEQAILLASKMCATNICDMLRMYEVENPETGSIEEGRWADLLIADIEGRPGSYYLCVRMVFVRGQEVWKEAICYER